MDKNGLYEREQQWSEAGYSYVANGGHPNNLHVFGPQRMRVPHAHMPYANDCIKF